MAIIIPSKNIYERSNDKVLDNKIKKIEVNASEVTPNNEYDVSVFTGQDWGYSIESYENATKEDSKYEQITAGVYNFNYVYLDNKVQYQIGVIKIPKLKDNKYINKIYADIKTDDFEDKGNGYISNGITVTVRGNVRKQNITSSIVYNDYSSSDYVRNDIVYGEETENERLESLEFPKMPFTVSYKFDVLSTPAKLTGLSNDTSVPTLYYYDTNDNYVIEYTILSYLKLEYLKGGKNGTSISFPFNIDLVGNLEIYEATQIDITINGDTIGIDLTEKPFVYGESTNSKAIFSIENNELIQTSTEDGFDIPKIIANNTISQYANGKETAEIRCSISDYKNEDGSYAIRIPKNKNEINTEDILVTTDLSNGTVVVNTLSPISPMFYDVKVTGTCANKIINGITLFTDFEVILKAGQYTATKKILQYPSSYEKMTLQNVKKELYGFRMQFQEGDIVIPYVLGANGIDKPMSLNKDNTPKAFEVISTEIYYDGAVWQNLVLQEYTSDFVDGDEVITDLTSTAWVFNDTLTAMPQTVFSVVFNPSGNSNISRPGLYWETTGNGDERGLWYARENQIDGTFSKGDSQIYSSTFGFWLDISAKQFTITGGTDATNTDLIEWLQANATML